MSNKNSRLILANNVKLDRNYNNICNISESNMISFLENNQVAQGIDFSFIRTDNRILVPFNLTTCLSANYMAFQNPDYSNKWFFAWIDEVNYKNDKTTEIVYTIDHFTTWYSYIALQDCFVIREHVNDDSVGANTYPEGLETGEFICNSHIIDDHLDNIVEDLVYILSSSVDLGSYINDPTSFDSDNPIPPSKMRKYNGIISGTSYYPALTPIQVKNFLEGLTKCGQIDALNGIFMAPVYSVGELQDDFSIQETNTPYTYTNSISKQTTLNGYIPVNKKLLCYPFNYLLVSNNNGTGVIMNYEDFSTSSCNFTINIAVTPGCSIRMIPNNYKGITDSDEYGINMGKLPICSYPVDMYTNWLTQNSLNIGGHTVTSDDINLATAGTNAILGTIGNIASGNVGGSIGSAVNGAGNIANSLIAKKQHELIPPQARGNLNAGDVITSSNKNNFHFYKMSIKAEYARMLDDYFTRYGYTVNRLKKPNITGRTYFNYVQIDSNDLIYTGNIPKESIEVINNIFRKGTTVWHNLTNIGNYSLDNSI